MKKNTSFLKSLYIILILCIMSIVEININATTNYIQIITVIYISLFLLLNRKKFINVI
ncbi:MAG: hypothetical protein ACRCYT_01210 [Cetobacterium sp.]